MAESNLSLRPFRQKDSIECRKLITASTMQMIPDITRIVLYKCLPSVMALLFPVAVIRWSVIDVLIYLGICGVLTIIFYCKTYFNVSSFAKALETDIKYYTDGSCMFVAELDRKIVGMCAVVKHHRPGEAQLMRMSVSSAVRKRGIGTKLIEKIEEFGRQHNYKTLFLYTSTPQSAAIGLYKKMGFEISERIPMYKLPLQLTFGLEVMKMEKDI